jgi:hypothetical protein
MTHFPSTAERIDHAVGRLLDGDSRGAASATAGLPAADRPSLEVASLLRDALPLPPVAPQFELRVGARLADGAPTVGREAVAWALRHPGRLIVTGAVGSAVTVGVTAYAVWRTNRRSAGPAHRLLHR